MACLRIIMDSAMTMQYSPISLLRKSVRGDMVPSKRIKDSAKPLRATRHHPAWIVAEYRFGLPLKTILTWVVCAIRARPIDPPAPARCWQPEQSLWRCTPHMVVQRGGALVKTASVPWIRKSEPLKVEMMTELVAESAEECSKGRDLLPHRSPH